MAKDGSNRGRRRRLQEPSVRREVLSALRDGCSLHDAAGLAGITYATLCSERKRNKEFDAIVLQAELASKRSCIKKVKAKKPEFLLERKWWKEYGRRSPEQIGVSQVLAIICPVFTAFIQKVPDEHRQWCMDQIEMMIERLRLKGKDR